MAVPRSLLAVLLLAAGGLAWAGTAAGEHPAERVTLVVVDGPRHDLAHGPEGPMQALYEPSNVTVGNDTWTAGPAKSMPGHAALLTGSPQDIANDGSQRPEDALVWERMREEHGWGAKEMRWLYQKDKLATLGTAEIGGGLVGGQSPSEAMLTALEAAREDAQARLVVASFAEPDRTGHEAEWAAHRDSLSRIAEGLAPMLAEAGEDELVIVTADHARFCEEPDDHGRVGPFGPVDTCDAHIPLWASGWHILPDARVEACLTQADVGVLVAEALNASFADPEGRFPQPLLDAEADWQARGCPPDRGGVFGVPYPPGIAVLGLGLAGLAADRLRRPR